MFKLRTQAFVTLRTGLVHGKQNRALAVVSRRAGKGPRLVHVASEGRVKGMLSWRASQLLLERLPYKKFNVSAVLDPSDYQLVMTEGVELPPDELRAAMRWRIRDLVSFPVEDAVVDVFRLPVIRGSENMVQVVAAPTTAITEVESILEGANKPLDVIDIPELALRNLMLLMPQDQTGCAFMLLGRSAINILVTCQGVLYVARRIELGFGTETDQLSTELQRSMQYYESQFDRAPITDVVIGPDNERARELAPALTANTGLNCQVLDLSAILPCEPGLGPVDQPDVLVAVGAALRPSASGLAA
jgi:MSHA biogenesis protein MshI